MSAPESSVSDEPARLDSPCSCSKAGDDGTQCQRNSHSKNAQNAPDMVTAADSDQSDSQSEQLKDSPCPALTNSEPSSAAVESVSISDSEAHCSADVAAVGIGTAAAAEKVAAADEGAESVAQSAGSQEAEGGVESAEAGDAVSGVTGGAGPGAMVEPENEAQAADRVSSAGGTVTPDAPAEVAPGSPRRPELVESDTVASDAAAAAAAAIAASLAAAAPATTTDDAAPAAAVPATTADTNATSSDGKPPTAGGPAASGASASPASSGSRAAGSSRSSSRPSSRPGSRPSSRPSSRSSSPAPDEPVVCRVACMSSAGQQDGFHKTNQDAYCFMRTKDKKSLIFGVFDGHGPQGHDVSKFIKERLPEILMEGSDLLVDPEKALTDGFLAVHDAALEETSFNCNISGTTAVVAHLYKQRLAVAWVGDSRAVLARRREGGERDDLMAVRLSADHKPNNDEERARIEASEGSVQQDVDENGDDVGPFRVWMKTGPMLGLAMSRSLGDKLAHTVGVSATPEVVVHRLDQSDAFLVLGSDGLWEYVGDDEAIGVVVAAGSIEAGVKALLALAKERWLTKDGAGYVDDITALVVGFTHRKV
ncbi:unnamed protein product [Closterium sp. NIES-64]|nr:unnamed protein product [Closterium sp. NIES-65]CAI5989019.1 unnamed protein product [Closterium sp. NIES-64]